MKKISFWSKNNPVKARIIIGISHLLIIMIAIFLGINSYVEDVRFSKTGLLLLATVFMVAYLLYPRKGIKEGLFKYSYRRRVKHDIVMLISFTFVLVIGVNQFADFRTHS